MEYAATGTIDRFLAKAKRRHLTNLALESVSAGAGAGAAGMLLLLLAGTQVLDWWWPVVLALIAVGVAAWRSHRRRLTDYQLAQRVDALLGLQDRISTVLFFRQGRRNNVLAVVEKQAEEKLAGADLHRAVPYAVPRYTYAAAGLMVAAIGLFGIRYGVLGTLDLAAPIARLDLGSFHGPVKVEAASKKSAVQERFEQQLRDLGIKVEDLDGASSGEALQAEQTSVTATPDGTAPLKADTPERRSGEKGEPGDNEGSEEGDKSAGEGSGQDEGDSSPQNQKGKQQDAPPDAKKGSSGSNDSMLNKMRDAFANLLNKLKMPNPSQQQQSSMSPSQQGQQQQQSAKGMQSKSDAQGQGQPSPDQQGKEGESSDMAGNQARQGERSADKPGNQDSKSGIGKSDGNKDVDIADQLAAMGKISEIYGKRAQELTGEITVEVSSGKQTLKTAYSGRQAAHGNTGGEVSRDEIPLMYQSYVQRYFEEIRKTSSKAKN